ncbi:iron chaperone [Demequina sp.]|uniref:iron chaperone n=1 Tax=Demequina sp. TaxID=2050685 RepID=UPI003A87A96C
MTAPTTHDAYIAAAPERFRDVLTRLRQRIGAAVPEAVETVAYGMPGFRLGTTTAIGYAAFSEQCGLYLPADAIAACADALTSAGLKYSKTGATFTAARPIPDDVLTALLDATRATLA